MPPSSLTPPIGRLLRRAAGYVPAGVALVSHADVVMTVSTLQGLSWEPPLVSVFFDRASRKGQAILDAGRFEARLLRDVESTFARTAASMPPERALVALQCEITRAEPVGDHVLVIAGVTGVHLGGGTPLVYWRRGLHPLRVEYPFLASPATLTAFIAAWEAGTLPARDWTHAAHVAVAACYAVRHGVDALDRTRAGIMRYNIAVGTANTDTSGYHETLTRFWSQVVACITAGCHDEFAAAGRAVSRLGEDRDLHTLCYACDVTRSVEARRAWVAPDWPIDDALRLTGAID